jgi:HD-GYP domain-containing protein (c-di-GMP phosphodiesterase class II)
MSSAQRFLLSFGQALGVRLAHPEPHQARASADAEVAGRLEALAANDPAPRFRFRQAGVEYGFLPLHEFTGWEWGGRLVAAGLERLEATAPVPRESLLACLDQVEDAMRQGEMVPDTVVQGLAWGGSAYGPLTSALSGPSDLDEELALATVLVGRAGRGEPLGLGDVLALTAAIEALVQGGEAGMLPLVVAGGREEYLPVHAVNTAILAFAAAGRLGLSTAEARDCARAALLHDVGMVRVPDQLLAAPSLDASDRARIRVHPVEGARMLLRQGDGWELAATVAYEHHLALDGGGYPRLSYPREPHQASRLVAVCSTYDALRAPRADRPGLENDTALDALEQASGTQLDPRMVQPFSQMLRDFEERGELALISRAN